MTLTGKRCLVTGANRGIGLEIAVGLAELGADLTVLCRNAETAARTAAMVEDRTGVAIDTLHADFSDLSEVRRVAAEVLDRYPRVDVLLHNAGLLSPTRKQSKDGIELTVAVNHLAPFLLTGLVLPRLLDSAPARIVTVASSGHRRAKDLDDLQSERDYQMMVAYGRSKLANIAFAFELSRRLVGTGVTSNAVHPGLVDTGLTRTGFAAIAKVGFLYPLFGRWIRNPKKGAETPVYLAADSEVDGVTGKYFVDKRAVPTKPQAMNTRMWETLWETSEVLTGFRYPRTVPAGA